PACASVNVLGALAIGAVAGAACALAVGLKFKFGYDDSLDVVGIHLVGGGIGTVLIGLVGTAEATTGAHGRSARGRFHGSRRAARSPCSAPWPSARSPVRPARWRSA